MEEARVDAWPEPLRGFAARYESDNPREAMEHACVELRRQARELAPPVGLRPMLDAAGARTTYERTSVDAILRRRRGEWIIALPERTSRRGTWRRERFTLAHELGHILICDALRDDSRALEALRLPEHHRAVESLCNYAAAELLMPREYVVLVLRQHGFGGTALARLYDSLVVSWRALLVRLGEVLPGASVTTWRDHARPDREERRTLRVTRSYRGSDGPWLPAGLTGRYLQPDPVGRAVLYGRVAEPEVDLKLSGRETRLHAVALATDRLPVSSEPSLFDLTRPEGPTRPDADVIMLAIDSHVVSSVHTASQIWEATLGKPSQFDEKTPAMDVSPEQLAFE